MLNEHIVYKASKVCSEPEYLLYSSLDVYSKFVMFLSDL